MYLQSQNDANDKIIFTAFELIKGFLCGQLTIVFEKKFYGGDIK